MAHRRPKSIYYRVNSGHHDQAKGAGFLAVTLLIIPRRLWNEQKTVRSNRFALSTVTWYAVSDLDQTMKPAVAGRPFICGQTPAKELGGFGAPPVMMIVPRIHNWNVRQCCLHK